MNRPLGLALVLSALAGGACAPAPRRSDPAIAALGSELTRLSAEIRQVQGQVRSVLRELIDQLEHDQLDIPSETTKVHHTIQEVRRLRDKLKTQRGQPLSQEADHGIQVMATRGRGNRARRPLLAPVGARPAGAGASGGAPGPAGDEAHQVIDV